MGLYNVEGTRLTSKEIAEKPLTLPEPTGYRILIVIPEIAEQTDGGIYRPEELRTREQTASVIGFVMKLGPDCYNDPKRFPNGPWCKAGDFVVFRSYSGTRIKVHGKELRLINDDTVEAVVEDPRGYERG